MTLGSLLCLSRPVFMARAGGTWPKSALKSQSQLLFVSRSLAISETSPWQDWPWNLSGKPHGPETVCV